MRSRRYLMISALILIAAVGLIWYLDIIKESKDVFEGTLVKNIQYFNNIISKGIFS